MKFIAFMISIFILGGVCFGLSQPAVSQPVTQQISPISSLEIKSVEGCYVGIFREGAPQNMGFIKSFEKTMSSKPASVMWYLDYSSDFPASECENVSKYGAIPHIVWEPWIWGEENKIKLDNIINGEWDTYIEKWAKSAKLYGKPVLVRWGHEFNIEKYPWGVGNNGRDPIKYITAYKHVHDIFNKVGAANVKWIWCFNNYPNPDEEWNNYELAYPGENYVDWIGIDGYNWGTTQTWSGWQSFKDLFRDQIRETSKKHPTKPVMIAEFGCAEEGGDKAAWVKEIPAALKVSMKQVKSIVLFDIKKECDWRSTSCKKTEDAYKAILKDPLFISSSEGMASITLPITISAKKSIIAKKAPSPIKIDGDFTPFTNVTPIVMDNDSFLKEGTSWKGIKDLSGSVYLMWDEQYLYMYAKVTDTFPMTNSKTKGDIWNGDAIEIVLPGYQIGFGTGDGRANKPSIWIWQKRRSPNGGEIYASRMSDPTGHIIEAKVPWKEMGGVTPKAGTNIGFDIALDDADEKWERKAQLVWSGDYLFYKDPSIWGILEFQN